MPTILKIKVWSQDNFNNMDWVIPTNYMVDQVEIKYIVLGSVAENGNKMTHIIKFGLLLCGNTIPVELGTQEMFLYNFWKINEWLYMKRISHHWYKPLDSYCVAHYKFTSELFKRQAKHYIMSDHRITDEDYRTWISEWERRFPSYYDHEGKDDVYQNIGGRTMNMRVSMQQ